MTIPTVLGAHMDTPEGITNPPIDDLLKIVDSKYSLVIMGAKRARQINAYYAQLGEGLLEYVGPLVETQVQEKPRHHRNRPAVGIAKLRTGAEADFIRSKVDAGFDCRHHSAIQYRAHHPRRQNHHQHE